MPTNPAVVDCGFYPDELCSALFEGKKAAPQIAQFCKSPPNSEVPAHLRTPGNCSRMARGLHFITRPLSAEERSFSLAYVIHTHLELATFVRLLRAIYAPQNVYCLHIDEKAPKTLKRAVQTLTDCFGNVFLSSKTQTVVPDNLRRLQAEIDCMKDLVHSPFQWRYVMNLCGQEFPIKTNKEIIRYIRTRWKGKNITPGVTPPPNTKPKTGPNVNSYTPPNPMFKQKPPHNLTIYSGSAHYALTRKFVGFVLTDPRAKDMLQWSKDIHSPEQHYWVTLNRLKGRLTHNVGDTQGRSWRELIPLAVLLCLCTGPASHKAFHSKNMGWPLVLAVWSQGDSLVMFLSNPDLLGSSVSPPTKSFGNPGHKCLEKSAFFNSLYNITGQ